jgi:hypothetical protein
MDIQNTMTEQDKDLPVKLGPDMDQDDEETRKQAAALGAQLGQFGRDALQASKDLAPLLRGLVSLAGWFAQGVAGVNELFTGDIKNAINLQGQLAEAHASNLAQQGRMAAADAAHKLQVSYSGRGGMDNSRLPQCSLVVCALPWLACA